ncbi:MAG: UDP-N-acetylglucosamine pyrophosphorylase [Oscillospiraceae bacterium]|nr:UDP-N-acetylglucosamine pyrophosphorylase [Oscillospiraceae bacterium]
MDQLQTVALFDLTQTLAAPLLKDCEYPWEALDKIKEFIEGLGKFLPADEYREVAPTVWVHRTALVYPSAFFGHHIVIGPRTEVRHGAFLRECALVGADAVVGNSTELKNVILFNHVQVPHYNYVGDSILGYYAHMGAGSITSNVKSDKTPVTVLISGGEKVATGRKKFGAMVGDHTEVGCNSVLNPGTVLGRDVTVYPLSMVRGFVPERHIFKSREQVVEKK